MYFHPVAILSYFTPDLMEKNVKLFSVLQWKCGLGVDEFGWVMSFNPTKFINPK